jgi:acyl carrier protein
MSKNKVQELHQIIEQVMADGGRVPQSEITFDSKLRSQLGFDSLELAVLAVRIEAEFGVDVFADGVVETVGEIERKILSGSREE